MPSASIEVVPERGQEADHAAGKEDNNDVSKVALPSWQKLFIVVMVSIAASFSGLASNIYYPAITTIADDLHVSAELVNLTITTYLIFQAIAPSILGPIADVKGRRIALLLSFTVFLAACIGIAVSPNYAALLVLRCLQSSGSASTIAIGSGVLSDITTREERGGYMGFFTAGLLVPLVAGPIIGGAIAASLGWRAIFWFLSIYSGVYLLLIFVLLPETLISRVGSPSGKKRWLAIFPLMSIRRVEERAVPGANAQNHPRIDYLAPLKLLVSKRAAPMAFFLATYYAIWQMSITAMSSLFPAHYGISERDVGLCFIANGVGAILGTLTTGKLLDRNYRRIKDRHESSQDNSHPFPIEQARLQMVPAYAAVQCLSTLLFGWTLQYSDQVSLAVPLVATFFTGWAVVSIQSAVTTYLIDIFPDSSSAATASLNLARCLLAAAGTSAIIPIVNGIGVGPAFSLCTGLEVVALLLLAATWLVRSRARVAKVS